MPYMGSKNNIVDSICLNFPKAENFYDLFGGGCSVTHYMLLHKNLFYKNFFYNEINSNIVKFLKEILNGKYDSKTFKQEWISRETFHERKDLDAYISLIWSFGNNQKTYLYGKDKEIIQQSIHNAIVFENFNQIAKEFLKIDCWPKSVKTPLQRTYYLSQRVNYDNKKIGKKFELSFYRPEHIMRLEKLKNLQILNKFIEKDRLTITNLSYDDVDIKKNSVVYCDIPYFNTGEYKNIFDHKKFFEWAATRKFPVFISEYEIDDKRFKCIYEIDRLIKLAGKGAMKIDGKKERLFWNGVML